MKPLPLHLKISMIASTISLLVMVIGFIIISASIAGRIQEEEKALAKLQAENLAAHLSQMPDQIDEAELQRLADTISGSRPNLVTVRIWKVQDVSFVEEIGSDDSIPTLGMSLEIQAALFNQNESEIISPLSQSPDNSLYQIYSPIVVNNRVIGAVETTERLNTIATIAFSYLTSISWIAITTFLMMTIGLYFVLQRLVYYPLGNLLSAMDMAKKGNLNIEVAEKENPDEFGKLSINFNEMMMQIRQMSGEREHQNEKLQEKVIEATSELKNKNEQLESANLELFQSSRKMSEMERLVAVGQNAAQFAHEVGTPLNIISGHVQLLLDKVQPDSPEVKRLLTVTDQIEKIEKTVREMLDRTRFDKTEHQLVNINSILKKTFEAVEPILGESRVVLKTVYFEDLPNIMGNSERLQQVFLNLIKNSLDALPNGGSLLVSTKLKDEKILLDFTDDGTGMSEETATKIFLPLFTTKERGQGTGLGLVIVKQILDEHNAQISVKSQLDGFTTFSLVFTPC